MLQACFFQHENQYMYQNIILHYNVYKFSTQTQRAGAECHNGKAKPTILHILSVFQGKGFKDHGHMDIVSLKMIK